MVSGYLYKIIDLEQRSVIIEKAVKDLTSHQDNFDAFVCRGFSSTVPGAILAHIFNKKLIFSRKENSTSHGYTNEGEADLRCVFIDDFICSGETLKRVDSSLKILGSTLYGIWLYNQTADYAKTLVDKHLNSTIKILNDVSSEPEQSTVH